MKLSIFDRQSLIKHHHPTLMKYDSLLKYSCFIYFFIFFEYEGDLREIIDFRF